MMKINWINTYQTESNWMAIVTLYIYTNTSCDQIRYKPGAINLYNKTKITFRHVQPNAPLS